MSITYLQFDCEWCGKGFSRAKGEIGGRKSARFCSDCVKTGYSNKYTKETMEKVLLFYKQGRSIPVISQNLSIGAGTVGRWIKKAGISRYPSMANKGKFGKNSSSWKGGKTPPRIAFMQTVEYKNWRMDVFVRDKFTCVSCGQVGRKLHSHHILSFVKYPALRTEIKNGVTLCESCHCVIHGRIKMGRYKRIG